jgi:hypothetical protein
MRRPLSSLTLLCLLGLAHHAIGAQAPAGGSTPQPAFRILKTVGTADEQTLLQRFTDRMRSKSGDATFMKSVDAATARNDYATARRLFADAVGVKATDVHISPPTKVGLAPDRRTPFAFASETRRFNPFMALFKVGDYFVCLGGQDACDTFMRQLGYTPVWR